VVKEENHYFFTQNPFFAIFSIKENELLSVLIVIAKYYKPSQKCRSRSRTRCEPMKKLSIHWGM